MPSFLTLFLTALPIALVIDLLWIGIVANRFYRDSLGELFAPNVNWIAALIFYAIFIAALTFFAIMPALEGGDVWKAVMLGAFLGFTAYATYDLTNLAVVRNWPVFMSIVDMVWGTVMSASIAGITYLVAKTWWGM